GLEKWIFAMLEAKRDPVAGIEELLPALRDRIVICTDLSGGVVPVDPDMRAWREAAGRVTVRLAQDADEVVRLFCGIPTRLK
ncbi:MAG: bifunctional adenosylcobinamide kinase/adenosylcobinamide-phosphate guanylyltransferase, partial [Oscillospiraceae bacterium]|nr:bifunctional adenosylcobinamide kinase/adenosylcobinamide-phosphate guanylyltransferase [Oscillospiraceae bacterium]